MTKRAAKGGATNRFTNQIHGARVREPSQIRDLLERGWVDDSLWLLRTIHEMAHVILHFTPVAEALALTELALDRELYEGMRAESDLQLVQAGRNSLSLAYDLLTPWSEAVAFITEWDLDLTFQRPTDTHMWMAHLAGPEAYDELLWQARLSAIGVGKKLNTLVSSCYAMGGHLLGHLLSRVLMLPGDQRSDYVLAEIKRCIFCNSDLAHAILDVADSVKSSPALERTREHMLDALAGGADCLYQELLEGPGSQSSKGAEAGYNELLVRMKPLIDEMEQPVILRRELPSDLGFLIDLSRLIAHASYSMRAFVGLGSAPVALAARGPLVVCSSQGVEVYSFDNETGFAGADDGTIERGFCALCGPETYGIRVSSDTRGILHAVGDDEHVVAAFKRARIPVDVIEAGQEAAAELAGAISLSALPAGGVSPNRQLAGELIRILIEHVTGDSIDLDSLSRSGVATALDNDGELLAALARLSNEASSVWTTSGRAALPLGPTVSDDQLSDLNTRLQRSTALPLGARTRSSAVVLW